MINGDYDVKFCVLCIFCSCIKDSVHTKLFLACGRYNSILFLPDFLSRPLTSETLDRFVALTKTSHHGIPFAASAPHEWTEMSFLQYHRRSPVHMHLPQEAGQTMSTKIWQYQPPPANTGADSIQLANR